MITTSLLYSVGRRTWSKTWQANPTTSILDSTLCKYREIVCIIIYNCALHMEDLSYESYESYYYY